MGYHSYRSRLEPQAEDQRKGIEEMELTSDELKLIDEAERAMANSKLAHIVLIALLLVFIAALFLELVSSTIVAIVCVAVTVCANFVPPLNAPSYAKIVKLLLKVRSQSSDVRRDPIVDALSKD